MHFSNATSDSKVDNSALRNRALADTSVAQGEDSISPA